MGKRGNVRKKTGERGKVSDLLALFPSLYNHSGDFNEKYLCELFTKYFYVFPRVQFCAPPFCRICTDKRLSTSASLFSSKSAGDKLERQKKKVICWEWGEGKKNDPSCVNTEIYGGTGVLLQVRFKKKKKKKKPT
ncbi:hypothetical protein POVWA2_041070 [Plasmodium ovale wallikeri]|uniref:Uncharacterized protein n=1 Tax=Plasmodium ovale wallikeri TaxID=864142 RepID=A0A1A8ZAY3_PLAOA|nr:hypothetical protein POVWA1_042570 [Plasmodium ovale wallikeri]SBT41031.1 hypothetical protein POVWA2_041070 [Plasmodium ovale wallikeri]